MIKKTVCVFMLNELGEVLVVRRKLDTNTVCLPGGKVDPGEDIMGAVIREVSEECGITLVPEELTVLLSDLCPDDLRENVYWCTCFYAQRPSSTRLWTDEPLLDPHWLTLNEFIQQGIFTEINESVLMAARKLSLINSI